MWEWRSREVSLYSRPYIARTLGTSEKGPIPRYLGSGPVSAAICLTSDRGIQCLRCSTLRIDVGKVCPMDSEVHNNLTPSESTCASEDTSQIIYVDLPRVTLTHMNLVFLESIRGLHTASQIRLYLGLNWLATAHPRYPRLTCITITLHFTYFINVE